MKNLLFAISLTLILASCRQFKPPVPQFVLSGKIENFDGDKIKLSHPLDDIEFEVDENGMFSDTISDFVDGYYKLVIGKEYTNIYIKDGFDLYFDIDVVDFDESITYKGIGANENNFLAISMLNTETFDFFYFFNYPEDTFTYKIDSFSNVKNEFLENHISSVTNLDKDFIKFERAKIQYFAPLQKENYQYYHRYMTKNEKFVVSSNFYNYRNNVSLEKADFIDIENYTNYVETYFSNNIEETDTLEKAFSLLRIINREITDNKLKKEFIYRSAKKNLSNVKKLDEYWSLIDFMVTNKREYKELRKLKRKLDKIKIGAISPFTNFFDENDKEYNLENFKGKIVYIDCWAQWCGPCKRETPFLLDLEKEYADKDIVFIKLSLDSDIDAWKNYIKENELEENAFVLKDNFKSKFAESYLIKSIPRFILLDKELKIVNSDAPRPSDEKIKSLIDEILTKDDIL